MRPAISPLPEDLDEDQLALYRAITGGKRASGPQHFPIADPDGRLHGPFGLMLLNPAIGSVLQELGSAIRFGGSLTPREREIAILTVGAITGSDFEIWAHGRVAAAVGLSQQEISEILAGSFDSEDQRERLCHSFSASLLTEYSLPERERAAAEAILGAPLLFELTVLVGYYFTLSRTMSAFLVGRPEDGDD